MIIPKLLMTLLKTGKNQLDNVIFVKDEWVDWRERDYHYLITQATQANIQLKFIEPTGNSHLLAFELAHIETFQHYLFLLLKLPNLSIMPFIFQINNFQKYILFIIIVLMMIIVLFNIV